MVSLFKFKQQLAQLEGIAKKAKVCPALEDWLKEDAVYAHDLIMQMQDTIRQDEIDHLLDSLPGKKQQYETDKIS